MPIGKAIGSSLTGVPIPFNGHKGPVYALTAAPGNRSFLSGGSEGLVVHWHFAAPDHGDVWVNVGQAIFSMHLLEDRGLLLIGTEGGGLHVIDLMEKREQHHFDVHRKGIFAMVSLPGDQVACAGGDGSISIWSFQPGERPALTRHIPLAEEKVRALALSIDGRQLAVGCGDGTVRLLDTTLFNEHHTLQAHPGKTEVTGSTGTTALAYHPDKTVLLSGGKDGLLKVWRMDRDDVPMLSLPAHQGSIYRIAFDPSGARFATVSRDKTIKVWDARDLTVIRRMDRGSGGHTHSVNAVLWSDGHVLSAGDDRRILAWPIH